MTFKVAALLVLALLLGLLVGWCAGDRRAASDREAWRDSARVALRQAAARDRVIDSLTVVGTSWQRKAEAAGRVADSLVQQADQTETARPEIPAPDSTPSDSVRYWRAQAENLQAQVITLRAAYRSQMEATAAMQSRAEAAELARDSLRKDNADLRKHLARGVELSEQSECRILGLLPCPSRTVTTVGAFAGGFLAGVGLAK